MTHDQRSARAPDAGVTLIEMLVVLTLFAVVTGAVVLSLPRAPSRVSAEVEALAFAADIDLAIDIALQSATGFGIQAEDSGFRFVQKEPNGTWRPHSHVRLAETKLFSSMSRNSLQETPPGVFAVSSVLVPEAGAPLEVVFEGGANGRVLTFDGARVRVEANGGV